MVIELILAKVQHVFEYTNFNMKNGIIACCIKKTKKIIMYFAILERFDKISYFFLCWAKY